MAVALAFFVRSRLVLCRHVDMVQSGIVSELILQLVVSLQQGIVATQQVVVLVGEIVDGGVQRVDPLSQCSDVRRLVFPASDLAALRFNKLIKS